MNDTGIAPAPHAAQMLFTGKNGMFRRIVTGGALLELVTFGLWRFWLATAMRRHLWSHTALDGDSFEYVGTGRELFLGFLLALAVVGPFLVLYALLGLEFERFKAFASLPLYAVGYFLLQYAVFRARRYRLTRTVWRGVRFWMTGSGWAYAVRSLLWLAVAIVTLGFAYPWRTAALERYKMRNTRYGGLQGAFHATGGALFRRVWWIWLLGLLPMLLIAGASVAAAALKLRGVTGAPLRDAGFAIIAGVALMPLLLFVHPIRLGREWRWWAGGLAIGEARVVCGKVRLLGTYWALYGMSVLVVAVFAGLFALEISFVLHARPLLRTGAAALLTLPPLLGAAVAVTYLAMLLSLGVVARIFTYQRVWKHVTRACVVTNAEALLGVTAEGQPASAFGEGLFDALDFAGF
jgi:hypothetical protein